MQHPCPGIQHKAALLLQTAKVSRKDRGTDRCHVGGPPACRRANYPPRLDSGVRVIGDTAFVLFVQPGRPRRARLLSGTSRKSLHIQSHYLLYMKKRKKANPTPFFHGNDAFFRFFFPNIPHNAKK
jgi:hypothetical protein